MRQQGPQQQQTASRGTMDIPSILSSPFLRRRIHVHPLVSSLLVLLVIVVVVLEEDGGCVHAAAATTTANDKEPPPHPDLNEDNHEGMVFIGRLCDTTGRRLSADHDNTIRYVFGTSFVVEEETTTSTSSDSHWSTILDTAALRHNDLPGSTRDSHSQQQQVMHKTRQQVLEERRLRNGDEPQGPVPFGHVETHPLDGGVLPVQVVAVEPFWLDITPVTNEQFAKFVQSTYYETEAEKYGWSFVLESFVPNGTTTMENDDNNNNESYESDPEAVHWIAVPGAYWRQPEGPGSSYKYRHNHPVVHVSHRDAATYCEWHNKRLPGEREYEAVARASHWSSTSRNDRATGGVLREEEDTTTLTWDHAIHNRTMYAWGDDGGTVNNTTMVVDANTTSNIIPDSQQQWDIANRHANLWGAAGPFPYVNDGKDGWRGTSPVMYYPPNDAGVYDTTGNVWEWMRGGKNKGRIVRGASYVDSIDGSINHAATLGARAVVHGTTTTGNIGFRCAKPVPKRIEHHWTWHDEEIHGELRIEDEYGKQHQHGTTTSNYYNGDDDDNYGDEDELPNEDEFQSDNDNSDKSTQQQRRKKKKVVLKPERIMTEL